MSNIHRTQNVGSAVSVKSAVLLGLLSAVHARDPSELLRAQISLDEHRDALSEIPPDILKTMLLSMLQEPKPERPRKPDMRSPLQAHQDQKKGKTKYQKELTNRLRQNKMPSVNEAARALEDFSHSDDLA